MSLSISSLQGQGSVSQVASAPKSIGKVDADGDRDNSKSAVEAEPQRAAARVSPAGVGSKMDMTA
jgi:hypothetical protein